MNNADVGRKEAAGLGKTRWEPGLEFQQPSHLLDTVLYGCSRRVLKGPIIYLDNRFPEQVSFPRGAQAPGSNVTALE